MKKRRLLLIASVLLAIVVAVLLSTKFGIKKEKEIVVPVPIFEVSPVLTNVKNWPAWFPGTDQYRFHVIDSSLAGVTVEAEHANVRSIYSIAAYPDSISARTRIRWTTLISGFDWMREKLFSIPDDPGSTLGELARYFESPKEFYGFDINIGKVVDTLVLTKEAMIKKTELGVTLGRLFQQLQGCANREHLASNPDTCRMATFYDDRKDSIRIAAGLPVSGKALSSPNGIHSSLPDGIQLLEMPPKGKMLVGRYQGPYTGLAKLYTAMRKYVADKKLIVIGAVYEKYLTKAATSRDSANMTIELHFPVL